MAKKKHRKQNPLTEPVIAALKAAGDEIDPLIREVVTELNAAGYQTFSSCQGRTCAEDMNADKHCFHSFVSFTNPDLLQGRKSKLKEAKLYVYNGGLSVTPLTGRETDLEVVFQRNLSFSDKLRQAFDLPKKETTDDTGS